MKLDIVPIDNNNFGMVADLLFERNQTLKSYSEWKYQSVEDTRFRGVIAKENGHAIGCFGSIPKEIVFVDGATKKCGWFADWYVSPPGRGRGVGKLLLNALSDYEPIMFGHPGPDLAQDICVANGYQPVGFQSRRRLILRRWSYHWKRGTNLRMLLLSTLKNRVFGNVLTDSDVSLVEENSLPASDSDTDSWGDSSNLAGFVQYEQYEQWILRQPISDRFRRQYGEWQGLGCIIKYFDERMADGEKRRSVLYIKGDNSTTVEIWNSFVNDTRMAKQDYIEIFTTDRKLDALLQKLGAWLIYEPPIMVRGLNDILPPFRIHPWDREGWTYLGTGDLKN